MTRNRGTAAVLALAVILSACQTVPVDGDFCYRNQPIRLSAMVIDQMDGRALARILASNERGEKLCGWRR